MEQTLTIYTEYIKLEAALKLCNAVSSGGEGKTRIQEGAVTVNGEVCTMRGRKLHPGDRFSLDGRSWLITIHGN